MENDLKKIKELGKKIGELEVKKEEIERQNQPEEEVQRNKMLVKKVQDIKVRHQQLFKEFKIRIERYEQVQTGIFIAKNDFIAAASGQLQDKTKESEEMLVQMRKLDKESLQAKQALKAMATEVEALIKAFDDLKKN